MILDCPNCETRYEIPVELPPEGRKVRCAACKHVWTAVSADPSKPQDTLPDFEDEEIIFREDTEAPESPEKTKGEANDDFSESGMEEAFSAVVEESAEQDSEEESPPIVIGRAKKKRTLPPVNLTAGWAALVIVLAGVTSFAYFQRVSVVRALPGAAAAYERIGLPVNVRGLEFEGVKYSWESSAGRQVLEVYGNIINSTRKPLKVPTVVFGLRTKERVEVYQWAADVRSEPLPAGEKTAFSAQIPTPPKSIRDVQVRFAKIR
jgi:predicted Zn finger-like uncharacterized protein